MKSSKVMTKIKDRCVLITGGASGIGRLMGRMALERGARALLIWDINPANITSTVEEFSRRWPERVSADAVDVADNEAVAAAYARAKERYGTIDILINNAGIVTGNRTFDRQTVDEIERTMNINAKAPMIVALQALPDMMARNDGHICNIGSEAGMISNPKMSVYVASKWAVLGWSDSVRIELRQARSRVRITTVAPYYINTGMFDGVSSPIFPILDPERTARKIIRAIERNRDFRGIPLGFHMIRFWQGVLPTSWFDFIFGRCFGIFSAMDNFTGRKHA